MVVDRNNWVVVFFYQCTHKVVSTLLHLWVSTLNSVELDTVAIATSIYRRYRTATETDAIVVTTYDYNLVAWLWFLLQAVALGTITYTTCKHDNLVVSILLAILLMFECEERTCDKRLTKLVTEVAGTIRSLYQYLLRTLIEPLAYWQYIFPIALWVCIAIIVFQTWVCCHINSCTSNRP